MSVGQKVTDLLEMRYLETIAEIDSIISEVEPDPEKRKEIQNLFLNSIEQGAGSRTKAMRSLFQAYSKIYPPERAEALKAGLLDGLRENNLPSEVDVVEESVKAQRPLNQQDVDDLNSLRQASQAVSQKSTYAAERLSTTCANGCNKEGIEVRLMKCARCLKVKYCSKECQRAHWSTHKVTCKKSGT